MKKFYESKAISLLFLLPIIFTSTIIGLILCLISNTAFKDITSPYLVGGFYLSYYDPIAHRATLSVLQLGLFQTWFIITFLSILLAILGKILEASVKNKVRKDDEVSL
ncbi:hypothetical protein QUE94_11870 [Lactococcus lactis]|uniref:hypothetical protein n=1 Tax=Lactococcus lactis TaxID=1358 RepID=UPI0025A2705A|nr:hypothetical protein [Lactococcus lactis]MDM7503305.1 hypothetical protein [Lactococcus lactis]MDM7522434.1 hypothetical protein [Lactococcus lactis]